MERPEPAELVPRLMAEFGYPRAGAELVAQKLTHATEIVWHAFLSWWQTGTLPELDVADYSLSQLMREHGMNPIAALLTLDWLAREPEAAKRSLHKGHDQVA